MKVKVVSVADGSFTGDDGQRVQGARLTFEENGQKREVAGFGPALAAVLQWKEGEEREIELFKSNAGKERFRIPREGGAGSGRKFEVAFRNTKEGQEFEQERMDRRTALMQAVALVPAIIAGGKTIAIEQVLMLAASEYRWLRETASTR